MMACFEDMCGMVDTFCQPGWLLRLACDAQLKEEFETLHQAIIELLKGEGLLALPSTRTPQPPDYKDASKPLRRLLKQLGSGDLSTGVKRLRVGGRPCGEVARLLGVPVQVLVEEAAMVPKSDLDLDTVYRQLLQPTSMLQRLGSGQQAAAAGDAGGLPADGQQPPAGSPAAAASHGGGGAAPRASAGGAEAAALYGDLFRYYDRNKSNALEKEEFMAVLADLGMLEGKGAAEARDFAASYMRMADAAAAARGEGVGYEAFCKVYEALVLNKARQQLRFKMGLQVEEDLRLAFVAFASFGGREPLNEMDGAHFQKLCRDCALLDGKHTTTTDADLIFTSVKTKGARRITYEQFLTALSKLAERKAVAFEEVVAQVLGAGGPVANATHAERVRLHDDKSCYTGVYARGGPSPTDQAALDLSLITNRALPEAARKGPPASPRQSPCDSPRSSSVRRFRMWSAGGGVSSHGATPGSHGAAGLSRTNSLGTAAGPSGGNTTPFSSFSCGPVAGGGSSCASGAGAPPPRRASTAGAVGFGSSSARCGSATPPLPPSGSNSRRASLAGPTPSSAGDGGSSSRRASRDAGAACYDMQGGMRSSRAGVLSGASKGAAASCPSAPGLKDVFSAFAGFGIRSPGWVVSAASSGGGAASGGGSRRTSLYGSPSVTKPLTLEMDGFRFVKLCREAGLFDGAFNSTHADIIFAKVKTKGAKKISYTQFLAALDTIADQKHVPRQAVLDALLHCGGPALNLTGSCGTADLLRIHDGLR